MLMVGCLVACQLMMFILLCSVGNIRVYCRIRPFLPGQSKKQTTIEYIGENGELVIANPSKQGSRRLFKFNKVFSPSSTQGIDFVSYLANDVCIYFYYCNVHVLIAIQLMPLLQLPKKEKTNAFILSTGTDIFTMFQNVNRGGVFRHPTINSLCP